MAEDIQAVLDAINQAIQDMIVRHPIPEESEEYNGSDYED